MIRLTAPAMVSLIALSGMARAETPTVDPVAIADSSADAYSRALPGTPESDFAAGHTLFRQAWLMAPARDDAEFVGLGPVYNDISCGGCHARNGGGAAPAHDNQPLHGMLVRLSIPGQDSHGGPNPHPVYGDQLNDHANPGIPAEGVARVTYTEQVVILAGGGRVTLRQPHLSFRDLSFGPLGADVMTSARIAQPVFGVGLLEAIPEAAIVAKATTQTGSVHGHPNLVWDIKSATTTIGRFGWKANQPSVQQQAASAANSDMGITSPLYAMKNCTAVQHECASAALGPQPELNADRLAQLTTYLDHLAPPAPRRADQPAFQRGQKLFDKLGCADCHVARWTTNSGQTIHPYTDLLVHDMGDGLADGRPDFQANGQEWRTAPLWGIGLAQTVNPAATFLHDGRARTLIEAILWHGGEAKPARDAVVALPPPARHDLLAFLNDL